MTQQYKVKYIPHPSPLTPEQIKVYCEAYEAGIGSPAIVDTYETKVRKAKKQASNNKHKKPQTKAQKAQTNRTAQIRYAAYKDFDKQYSKTYLILHKEELKKLRTQYFKDNRDKYAIEYDAALEKERKSEVNRRYRQKQKKKGLTPEQIQRRKDYAKAYRAAHRDKHLQYMKEYNAQYKERKKK